MAESTRGEGGRKPNPIQLQKYLKGVDYPASKDDLVERARGHGADEHIIDTLQRLPRDRFNSPNDVSEAIGDVDR
ncbi:MAG TPA: DUF2795 domain-containing protein [Candidatus Tectomicrobia bacterium]|nr:DUF2795 domain-containing protein [Candidatus Tectomicrobia bacterium]